MDIAQHMKRKQEVVQHRRELMAAKNRAECNPSQANIERLRKAKKVVERDLSVRLR